jgi:preprotein translocase subunit SecE
MRAFAGESWAELRKVDWPGRPQLVSATIVVIIAVAIVGAYLFAADWVLQRFVRDVLLNL